MAKIRSNFVKESLLDYENLAKTLKENTSSAVKDLLSETVRETYAKLLSEEDENEYEEEEVEDTDSENTNDAEDTTSETDGSTQEEVDEVGDIESELDGSQEPMGAEGEMPVEGETEEPMGEEPAIEGSEGDEWAQFDKYKVSDDEYDFSEAEDEDIVKVYKLMKDEDQVLVNVDKNSNRVDIKDNSTGAEYVLDLGSIGGGSNTNDLVTDETDDIDAEGDLDYNQEEDMNESRIFEIALNEYDSHVGYTDNYQSKDVMTNPGMSEPGKNVRDWDAGVPKDSKKPWASKGSDKPFDKKGATRVEEEVEPMIDEEEEAIEEANLSQSRWNDTHAAHNRVPAANDDAHRRDGMQKTSKGTKYRAHGTSSEVTTESRKMKAQVNKILKENSELKSALMKFRNVLQEASVTNKNLGQIVKLVTENTTTKAEKMEIISRFGKEAKTIEDSERLYESISRELKKNSTMNINEDRQFTANGSKMINETQIYQSKDLLDSLDLMHRIC